MLLRHLALSLTLIASAAFAAEVAPAAKSAGAPMCTEIAADQVPAPAKAALVKGGADLAKLSTCTMGGVASYCATVTGADGKPTMIAVDAAGAAIAVAGDDCACCAPAAPAAPAPAK